MKQGATEATRSQVAKLRAGDRVALLFPKATRDTEATFLGWSPMVSTVARVRLSDGTEVGVYKDHLRPVEFDFSTNGGCY